MARTDSASVAAVLVDSSTHSKGQGDWDGETSLTPYIDTANSVVTSAAAKAVENGESYADSTLELMERWLAAHYYTVMDPLYKSKSTDRASASFNERSYKDVALELDPLGYLAEVIAKHRARGFWLGRAQDQYDDANEVG